MYDLNELYPKWVHYFITYLFYSKYILSYYKRPGIVALAVEKRHDSLLPSESFMLAGTMEKQQ